MKPKQKLRLLALVVYAPYILALLYVLIGHHHPPKWFIPAWIGYGATGLTCLILYLLRHPELRTSPQEEARRLAMIDPRTAKMRIIGIFAANLAFCSFFLFHYREPPSNLVCAQGVARAYAMWGIYRGVAWVNIVLSLAVFLRLCSVSYRKKNANCP